MQASNLLQTKYISIGSNDHVSCVLGKFKNAHTDAALVFDGNTLKGMFDHRKVLQSRINTSKEKMKRVTKPVPVLTSKSSLLEMVKAFHASDMHALPVVKAKRNLVTKGNVLGVVSVWSVLKELAKDDNLKNQRAQALMGRKKLLTLTEKTPISKAINTLKQAKIDHLPIVGKKNRLIGMVTTYDLMMNYMISNYNREGGQGRRNPLSHPRREINISRLPVVNDLVPLVKTAGLETKYHLMVKTLASNKISSVVIEDMKEPIGIVTIKDLLKAAVLQYRL